MFAKKLRNSEILTHFIQKYLIEYFLRVEKKNRLMIG